jgi:hypothetical protein
VNHLFNENLRADSEANKALGPEGLNCYLWTNAIF